MDRAWQKKHQAEHQKRINRARRNMAGAKAHLDMLVYAAMKNKRPDVRAVIRAKQAFAASQDILQIMEQVHRNTRQMSMLMDTFDGVPRKKTKPRRREISH